MGSEILLMTARPPAIANKNNNKYLLADKSRDNVVKMDPAKLLTNSYVDYLFRHNKIRHKENLHVEKSRTLRCHYYLTARRYFDATKLCRNLSWMHLNRFAHLEKWNNICSSDDIPFYSSSSTSHSDDWSECYETSVDYIYQIIVHTAIHCVIKCR